MKLGALSGALTAAAVGLLALAVWSWRLPDLEVRTAPRRTAIGNVRPAGAVGEVFTVERDGLWRVDVAVDAHTEQPPSEVELVLRGEGPQGAELRRVRAERLEPMAQGGWLHFEFEPVLDSAGRTFHASLRPAEGVESCGYAPWARFRGMADLGAPWGPENFPAPLVEGEFISLNPNLRGLAFGGQELQGPATLVLFDSEGRELRRATALQVEPMEWGWLLFSFEPLPVSRWKTLRFRIELDGGGHLVGSPQGPARVGFYGGGQVDVRLGGMTQGKQLFGDRDLTLRAWTDNGPALVLLRLHARIGWKAAVLALAWLLASTLLPAALGRSPRA